MSSFDESWLTHFSQLGINWNGDTPVILGPDAPDLGGLLVTHTLISGEWRLGQLKPGDKIRFRPVSFAASQDIRKRLISFVDAVAEAAKGDPSDLKPLNISVDSSPVSAAAGPVLLQTQPSGQRPGAIVRASGDRFVSVEYGDMKVDLTYRCQIELLDRAIADKRRTVKGLGITNPNLRSMSLQFDPSLISQEEVVSLLKDLDESLPSAKDIKLPTRQFTLPVTFEDPNIDLATKRYAESVRSKAAYLPSNKEYLRKANGMGSFEDVEDVAVGSTLLAVAVGFYLSTPILVVSPRFFISHELLSDSVKQPTDPRKRIMSQKLNPTRTWTPRGALGFGGSCAAIYGMDSPGGYQLLGRTIPSWDPFTEKPGFTKPWLFRAFDTIKFERVPLEEYEAALQAFDRGTYEFDIKQAEFVVGDQVQFEDSIAAEVTTFRENQRSSLAKITKEEERLFLEWSKEQEEARASGASTTSRGALQHSENAIIATAPMNANVWKVLVKSGETVEPGAKIAVLEAMKTEQDIFAPEAMKIVGVLVKPGDSVRSGDALIVGEP